MLGKIYKIVSPSTSKFFVGSTLLPLDYCFNQHVDYYNHFLRYPYQVPVLNFFEILKYKNARIELIIERHLQTQLELHLLEQEYIKKLDCINKYTLL